MAIADELDDEKIFEAAIALLSLSRERHEFGYRVWKGLDWDVMDALYEKGWISNPVGKQKSVALTEEGLKRADECLVKYFGKDSE